MKNQETYEVLGTVVHPKKNTHGRTESFDQRQQMLSNLKLEHERMQLVDEAGEEDEANEANEEDQTDGNEEKKAKPRRTSIVKIEDDNGTKYYFDDPSLGGTGATAWGREELEANAFLSPSLPSSDCSDSSNSAAPGATDDPAIAATTTTVNLGTSLGTFLNQPDVKKKINRKGGSAFGSSTSTTRNTNRNSTVPPARHEPPTLSSLDEQWKHETSPMLQGEWAAMSSLHFGSDVFGDEEEEKDDRDEYDLGSSQDAEEKESNRPQDEHALFEGEEDPLNSLLSATVGVYSDSARRDLHLKHVDVNDEKNKQQSSSTATQQKDADQKEQ
jgi:hypothetical protein